MSSLERNFLIVFGLVTLLSLVQGSCWRYGHSCWGGHGKRSGQGQGPGHVDRRYAILPLALHPSSNQQVSTRLGDSFEIEQGEDEDIRNLNSVPEDEELEVIDEVKLPPSSSSDVEDDALELDRDGGGEVEIEPKQEIDTVGRRGLRKGRRRTVLIYGVLGR